MLTCLTYAAIRYRVSCESGAVHLGVQILMQARLSLVYYGCHLNSILPVIIHVGLCMWPKYAPSHGVVTTWQLT